MLDIAEVGVEALRRSIAREVVQFKREQKIKMRRATNVIRQDLRRRVRAEFHHDKALRQFARAQGARRGSFERSIGTRIFGQSPEITGRIALFNRAYYSIHEAGGVIRAKGFDTRAKRHRSWTTAARLGRARAIVITSRLIFPNRAGTGLVSAERVVIPAHPVFGPSAIAKRDEAVRIVGEAFDVFTRGG